MSEGLPGIGICSGRRWELEEPCLRLRPLDAHRLARRLGKISGGPNSIYDSFMRKVMWLHTVGAPASREFRMGVEKFVVDEPDRPWDEEDGIEGGFLYFFLWEPSQESPRFRKTEVYDLGAGVGVIQECGTGLDIEIPDMTSGSEHSGELWAYYRERELEPSQLEFLASGALRRLGWRVSGLSLDVHELPIVNRMRLAHELLDFRSHLVSMKLDERPDDETELFWSVVERAEAELGLSVRGHVGKGLQSRAGFMERLLWVVDDVIPGELGDGSPHWKFYGQKIAERRELKAMVRDIDSACRSMLGASWFLDEFQLIAVAEAPSAVDDQRLALEAVIEAAPIAHYASRNRAIERRWCHPARGGDDSEPSWSGHVLDGDWMKPLPRECDADLLDRFLVAVATMSRVGSDGPDGIDEWLRNIEASTRDTAWWRLSSGLADSVAGEGGSFEELTVYRDLFVAAWSYAEDDDLDSRSEAAVDAVGAILEIAGQMPGTAASTLRWTRIGLGVDAVAIILQAQEIETVEDAGLTLVDVGLLARQIATSMSSTATGAAKGITGRVFGSLTRFNVIVALGLMCIDIIRKRSPWWNRMEAARDWASTLPRPDEIRSGVSLLGAAQVGALLLFDAKLHVERSPSTKAGEEEVGLRWTLVPTSPIPFDLVFEIEELEVRVGIRPYGRAIPPGADRASFETRNPVFGPWRKAGRHRMEISERPYAVFKDLHHDVPEWDGARSPDYAISYRGVVRATVRGTRARAGGPSVAIPVRGSAMSI